MKRASDTLPGGRADERTERPALFVIQVSLVVGFSIMGDSFLYGILPLAALSLGLGPEQVGLILSANRLVRLVTNTWVSAIFARHAPYWPFLGSALLGSVAALLYGVSWGFAIFVAARLLWGLAWSGLRQGAYQAVWAGGPGQTGRLMGLMWGVIRAGSAVSVILGGYLYDRYGYGPALWVIVGLTTVAILLAWGIRWPLAASGGRPPRPGKGGASAEKGRSRVWASWREALADPRQAGVIGVGALKLVLDGVLVATVALFLAQHVAADQLLTGLGVGTVAGAVLATRWLSDLVVGPLIGSLADRVGHFPTATGLVSLALALLILALQSAGWLSMLAMLLVLVTSTGINISLDAAANRLAQRTGQPEGFIGVYTTASDGGAALGPLLGLPLVSSVGFGPVYLGLAALLLVAVGGVGWLQRAGK